MQESLFVFCQLITHEKMSIGEKVIDSITKSLFESAKIDPYRFRNQAKQTLRKDFDHFSEPFKLNKEEKEIKSGLFNVVKGNLDNGAIIHPISRGKDSFAFLACRLFFIGTENRFATISYTP